MVKKNEQCKSVNTVEITVQNRNDNAKDETFEGCIGFTFSKPVDLVISS